MYFKLPLRFRNGYIFCGTLFESLDPKDLTKEILREKLRCNEFLERYEMNLSRLQNEPKTNLARIFDLTYVITENKKRTKFISYGKGRSIYIRESKQSLIFTDPLLFYYVPDGLKFDGKYLTDFESVFKFLIESCNDFASANKNYVGRNFNPCPLERNLFDEIEDLFNISINIYSKTQTENSKRYFFKNLRLGKLNTKTTVNFHKHNETEQLIFITNPDVYFQNHFQCENENCRFTFSKYKEFLRHKAYCSNILGVTQIEVKQKEIRNRSILLDKARKLKVIPANLRNEDFIFFDIESALPKSQKIMPKSKVLSTHKLISIAANSYVGGSHECRVWTVADSSHEAQVQLVENFVNFCYAAKSKHKEIKNLSKILLDLRELTKDLNNVGDFDNDEIWDLIQYLKSFTEIPIYGFNNARYDNKIIFPLLIECLEKRGLAAKDIKILKKSATYFSINFDNFCVKDLIHFTAPVSLDKYLKTWLKNENKLVYPYEFFSDIFEIRNCLDFPEPEAFYSALKGPVDLENYKKCKAYFDYHRNLPNTHKYHWPNFESYLKHYNLSDVLPASRALIKQFEKYEENFGISPMQYLGLPSFARNAMLALYKKDSPSIFTFPDRDTTNDFRTQIIGGLTNVYHRHVTTDVTENAAHSAKFSKNGEKWQEIRFYDVNAMYPSTFKNLFPCGLGFKWVRDGGKLSKNLMTYNKISIQSVQWLD